MTASEFAKFKELTARVAALEERIAALEAKRGPGRPPLEKAA
jgi:uncharacterized small protein (DUF1192 family)